MAGTPAGAPGKLRARPAGFAFRLSPRLNFHFKVMALTIDDVRKIATLARLRFTPAEEAKLAAELDRIVGYIDQLQVLDAGEDAGAAGAAREAEDRPVACLPRASFLANAPAVLDPFLLVPEVKAGASDEPVA
jgi:aspartyl-tRNA(Asn)/glutamyl-tRNA(Gln) amidotransferase subunit C